MRSIDEALAEILPHFTPLGSERVGLDRALGRFLAEGVRARVDLPPFANSAMDGYAVRAESVPGPLPVRGESRAGGPWPEALVPGTAMRIFTGAPLPEGADAVVMQEDVTREGDTARFAEAARVGQHVRARGEDLAAGASLLEAHAELGPGELGALASQHRGAVYVFRRPRVAILSTGDELIEVSDAPSPGKIVDSNAYAIAAQVQEAGGDPWVIPRAPDDLGQIEGRVREALRADAVVSIGGVSVGDYDLVHEAFARAGVVQQFWKVAMKPGKPLAFGVSPTGTPVVGLPGNPVSAGVTFEVFVRPGLRQMLGDPRPFRPTARVRLAHAATHKTGRTELARATLEHGAQGVSARLNARQGSGSLTSLLGAEALVVLPADQATFPAGTPLQALLLRPRGGAEAAFTRPLDL